MNRIFLTFLLLTASALALREVEHYQTARRCLPPVTVYVAGAVQREGAVRLPAGARRIHALEVAGGVLDDADLRELEPARPLQDGETIWIPQKPRIPEKPPREELVVQAEGAIKAEYRSPANKENQNTGKLDINSATAEELQQLPGIGPVLAVRIVEARNAQPTGTFSTIEDLGTIRGIKGKTMARLAPYLELEAYDR